MQLRKPPPHHCCSYINLYINPIPAAYTHHNLPWRWDFPKPGFISALPTPKNATESLKPQERSRKPHPHVCFARGKAESRGGGGGGGAAVGPAASCPQRAPSCPDGGVPLLLVERWLHPRCFARQGSTRHQLPTFQRDGDHQSWAHTEASTHTQLHPPRSLASGETERSEKGSQAREDYLYQKEQGRRGRRGRADTHELTHTRSSCSAAFSQPERAQRCREHPEPRRRARGEPPLRTARDQQPARHEEAA